MRWRRSTASRSACPRSGGIFDLDRKRSRIALIERDSTQPGFWDDNTKAQALLKEKSTLESKVGTFDKAMRGLDDAQVLMELAAEANDADSAKEAEDSLLSLEGEVAKLELARMLSGPQDHNNCFMDINPGAGGTDAMDWAAMLLRMYSRYAETKGWTVEISDEQPGEEAGFKNVSLRIAGENAYGYLKAEVGVHRLVRISPFDANARRQTAFASVDVYPEVDDTIQIDIPEKDIELKFIRGGGAGGQKVNKTSSTAQLRHLPTGIIITCQTERSQSANKDMAFQILRGRLFELEMKKREAERDAAEAQKKDISFGSQIRSYVLAPYRMVKDLRTGVETGNVDSVLDGDLDEFIVSQLLGVKNPNRNAALD
ncbi:peptide chain release factor 2 [Corallococcus sp. H22C18031201]|nr:peptide chain release factor 2 [Citreicoccus inhibens]RJS15255.1 peptide chain release factor 2 [Corallococcus sp. H22C18031201]